MTVEDALRSKNLLGLSNSSLLLLSNLLSQALTAIALVPMAKAYPPSAFGMFGTFLALTQTIGLVSTLRFDIAIPIPRSNKASAALLASGSISAMITAGSFFLLSALLGPYVSGFVDFGFSYQVCSLISATIFFVGVQQSFIQISLRSQALARVAVSVLFQSFVTISIQYACSTALPTLGLQIGYAAGIAASTLILIYFSDILTLKSSLNIVRIWAVFKKYIGFALVTSLSSILRSVSNYAPVVYFGVLFSSANAGVFLVAFRLISMPVDLLGRAINQIVISTMSNEIRSERDPLSVLDDMNAAIWRFSVIPIGTIFVLVPTILPFFFDGSWIKLGVYVQLLTLGAILQFSASTLIHVMFLNGAEGGVVKLQVTLLVSRVVGLMLGLFWPSPTPAVLFFSVGSAAGYVIMLSAIYRSCGGTTFGWFRSAASEAVFAFPFLCGSALFIYALPSALTRDRTGIAVVFVGLIMLLLWVKRLRSVPVIIGAHASRPTTQNLLG
jgi:lipopolysaccharide exporter